MQKLRRKSDKEIYEEMKREYLCKGYFHQGTTRYGWIIGDFNCGCKFCKIK